MGIDGEQRFSFRLGLHSHSCSEHVHCFNTFAIRHTRINKDTNV